MKGLWIALAFAVVVSHPEGNARAQERPAADPAEFALPDSPQQWINSGPLSVEQLRGKAVFLWFFEEDCPRCREKWTDLLATARKYSDEPVLFIAVNSGTPRGEIESYVKDCRITWPIIVDPGREFEKAAGLREITLQNIYQAKAILPDGSLVPGSFSNIEGTVDAALKTAAWKVSPKDVPASLKGAWLDVELGHYSAAAAAIKKSLNSGKADVKAGAEKLNEAVSKERDGQLAEAKEALEADEKWKAYTLFTQVAEKFKGFEIPDDVEKSRKSLASDAAVRDEIAALRQYESAIKQLSSAAAPQRKRGITALEKLVKDKPETEAARKAQAALDKAGG